jgi:aspartyl-tRNA(Asn)/glutamyl-tRNA(Gln) amidotransferase subunit B
MPRPRVVIGLEVHIQISTKSKVFCHTSNKFGGEPNTHTCPRCLGMPGTLPVFNEDVLRNALKFSVAIGADIPDHCSFARKQYFYPDLPKGYQISQFEECIAYGGGIEIDTPNGKKLIGMDRIQVEEDAGKSLHSEDSHMDDTLVDVNRCGTPLLEVISLPQPGQPNTVNDPSLYMNTPDEAIAYWTKMRQIARYLGISECNMEEGNMRCDANISIWDEERNTFGTKTEIKNINSFRFAHRALELEIVRHLEVLEDGGKVQQNTMLYDAATDLVLPMRSKEEAHDYRYFPEPDLVPLEISTGLLDEIRAEIPELPDARRERLTTEHGLTADTVELITTDRPLADYFEGVVKAGSAAKQAANWVSGELLREMNARKMDIQDIPVPPENLAELISLIDQGTISNNIAKEVFAEMVETKQMAGKIVQGRGMEQISDEDALEKTIAEVIAGSPDEMERFRGGEKRLMGFFMGQVMRATGGKANPKVVTKVLGKLLNG